MRASQYDARTGQFPWNNYAVSLGVVVVATAITIGLQFLRSRRCTWGESFWTLIGVVMLLMLPVSLVRYAMGLG